MRKKKILAFTIASIMFVSTTSLEVFAQDASKFSEEASSLLSGLREQVIHGDCSVLDWVKALKEISSGRVPTDIDVEFKDEATDLSHAFKTTTAETEVTVNGTELTTHETDVESRGTEASTQETDELHGNEANTHDTEAKGNVMLIATNSNSTPIAGVTYRIWGDGYDCVYKTGRDGAIRMYNLKWGKYVCQMLTAPEGYYPLEDKVYTFELSSPSLHIIIEDGNVTYIVENEDN